MAAPVPTRAARAGDRRTRLVEAAGTLFAERGYDAVAVEDVAAAAGVTGPGVYRHFADKQALLAAVVLAGLTHLEEHSAAALGAGAPGAGAPRLLAGLAALAVQRPDAAVVWRWTGVHLAPAQQREVGRRVRVLLAGWAAVVTGQRPELAAADAELLCWAVMSVLGSTTVHRTRLGTGRSRELLTAAGLRVLAVTPRGGPAEPGGPPEPGEPAGAVLGSRREQILEAASRLFAEHGYHAVGVDDIGAAVGIAGPSVYRHFPSKVSVLVAVCRRAADRLALGVVDALRAGPAERVVERLVDSYVTALLATTDLRVGISTDRAAITGAEREALRRRQREHVAHWVRALQQVHPDLAPAEAAVVVHAGLTVANDLARTRRTASRGGVHDDLVALVLAVLDVARSVP